MKVLVTGATGFIGGRLVEMLVDGGHRVVAASRHAKAGKFPDGVTARDLDITDAASIDGAFDGVDAVVHTAALVGDWGDRSAYFRFDEGGTQNVLHAARAAGVPRFVHTSSFVVYPPETTGEVGEDLPRIPPTARSAYAAAKSAAEGVVEEARAQGYPATIVRPGNVYGPRSHHWVVRPVKLMKRGLFHVPGDAGPSNTVHVDNVCALLVEAATGSSAALGETFNIVDGQPRSWVDYFGRLAGAVGRKASVWPRWTLDALGVVLEAGARVTGRPPLATREAVRLLAFPGQLSMRKAERLLGWKPPLSADESMARTLAWLASPEGVAAIS